MPEVAEQHILRTNEGLGSCYEDGMQTSFPSMNLTAHVVAAGSARADSSLFDERAPSRYTTEIVVAAGNRTGWQRVTSGIGASGVAMLVPVGILAVGVPIVLAARALIEVAGWLTSMVFR